MAFFYGFGLLEDFLEHEVGEAAFGEGLGVVVELVHLMRKVFFCQGP